MIGSVRSDITAATIALAGQVSPSEGDLEPDISTEYAPGVQFFDDG